MAKTSMIEKEKQKTALVQQGKLSRIKLRNRCSLCGRPRGFYRQFGLCRLHLRELAHQGKLPGVLKSSW